MQLDGGPAVAQTLGCCNDDVTLERIRGCQWELASPGRRLPPSEHTPYPIRTSQRFPEGVAGVRRQRRRPGSDPAAQARKAVGRRGLGTVFKWIVEVIDLVYVREPSAEQRRLPGSCPLTRRRRPLRGLTKLQVNSSWRRSGTQRNQATFAAAGDALTAARVRCRRRIQVNVAVSRSNLQGNQLFAAAPSNDRAA